MINVGDRVIFKHAHKSDSLDGSEATVIEPRATTPSMWPFRVQLDNGESFPVEEQEITVIKPEPVLKFKVGDKVIFASIDGFNGTDGRGTVTATRFDNDRYPYLLDLHNGYKGWPVKAEEVTAYVEPTPARVFKFEIDDKVIFVPANGLSEFTGEQGTVIEQKPNDYYYRVAFAEGTLPVKEEELTLFVEPVPERVFLFAVGDEVIFKSTDEPSTWDGQKATVTHVRPDNKRYPYAISFPDNSYHPVAEDELSAYVAPEPEPTQSDLIREALNYVRGTFDGETNPNEFVRGFNRAINHVQEILADRKLVDTQHG